MSEFSLFFAQNAPTEVVEDVIVSKRFQDEEGNPVKWKIRSITEEEHEQCRKASTKKIRSKSGAYIPDVDHSAYLSRMIAMSVVYPDLKNSELLKSYGVLSPESLLGKMLLPGEYTTLMRKAQALSGFDQSDVELIEEVKN